MLLETFNVLTPVDKNYMYIENENCEHLLCVHLSIQKLVAGFKHVNIPLISEMPIMNYRENTDDKYK